MSSGVSTQRTGIAAALVGLLLGLFLGPSTAQAQLYRFGKNKVQYTQFAWQKMETPHFDIYFYPEEEELAGFAAEMAEASYFDLEKKFAHTVQRRIPLILYSSHVYFEQTNIIPNFLSEGVAGFTEWLKGRVALPLSGSLPEFRRVLHHELVHVFMFDRIRTVLRRNKISTFRGAPLWFSEGIAEYWSSTWDSYADMIIRDALFSGRLVPIARMEAIYGTFQMYKEGQSICAFMAQTYGDDIFELLFDNWWRGEDFAEVFHITTGEPLSKLDERWQYQIQKDYLPDIERGDLPSQMGRPLTREGFNLKPAIVPGKGDSAEVVFFRNDQGYTYLARTSLEGGVPEVVVEGERDPAIESLHPLSSKIAVDPAGRRVAAAAKSKGRDRLFVWDLASGHRLHQLVFDPVVAIASPSWSPDGGSIVFSGTEKGGTTELYIVEVESGQLDRLTDDIYHDRDPDWSPDGHQVVFASDRWSGGKPGRHNLFLYTLATDSIRVLTPGEHNDFQPAWSPDGRQVLFTSDRDTMYNLYTVEVPQEVSVDSLAVHRLSRALTGVFDPEWLPDQGGVVFTGFEGGGFQLYRLDLDEGAIDSTEIALVDSATWTLVGHGEAKAFARRDYKKKFTFDVAQSQISQDPEFGTSGGILVALSDVLGDDKYYFVLSHISGSETGFFDGLNMAFSRSHLARQLNVDWGVFRLNDRFTSTFGRFLREKRTGAYLGLGYPFSRSDRLNLRLSVRHADIDRRFEGQALKGWLASNYISYTHDSSLWIPTGPLEGTRYSLGVGQSVDFKSSRRFNVTVFGDYRHYHRLNRRSALAMRLMGRHSRGDVPEFFSLGGSWTLRGYPWRSLWGNNMVLANLELRFPLVDRLLLGFPFGNMFLGPFRGALFADGGNAWSGDFDRWRGSFGAGVRLALGGVFVFRLDGSRRTDFTSVGGNTNWDFFFGWDF